MLGYELSMGVEILRQSGMEINHIYTNKDHHLNQDKARILRQVNDHSCVYLIIGYETKSNILLFDDPL